MPNGIIIIDKPMDWTASGSVLNEHRPASGPIAPDGRSLLFAPHPLRWAAPRWKGAAYG